MRINVHINPGASRNEVVVMENLMGEKIYKVYVKAKPVDGEANKSLMDVIAEFFLVKKRQVSLVSGFKSRYKVVEILEE